MKKKFIILSFVSLTAVCSMSSILFSNPVISKAEEDPAILPTGSHTINVLNVQDYIDMAVIKGIKDDDGEYIFSGFEQAMNEKYGVNDIKVIYSTTDTPETMFNNVKLTPGGYDLICPSDYMIQKLISEDMITPLNFSLLNNYNQYVSKYITQQKLNPIEAVNKKTNKTEKVGDYAVGYMWGTLGMIFDAEYEGRSLEKTVSDMQSWDIMWNPEYKGIGTIKDSVRDTYAIGLLHAYNNDYDEGQGTQEGFQTLHNKYVSGDYDGETYNKKFSDLFNRCDQTAINKVDNDLNILFKNVFGLEVDQGKQDIVEGKIGINFAWSGDAVYSLDLAEGKEINAKELYYSIPETGSNVWFDAWVMPKYEERDACKTLLAHEFLNYLSDPEVAAMNMNETGYTSFIGGNDIRDLVLDWYDYRTELIYYLDEENEYEDPDDAYLSLYYVDPYTGEETEAWYEDCHFVEDSDEAYDNVEVYYYNVDENPVTLENKYNEQFIIPDDVETVDLNYFFDGTLSDDDTLGATFYSYCYLPFYNEDGSHNVCVGRQFFTQYPDLNTLTRCAVMRDFGDRNGAVMAMWESFRSTSLPVWAIILFAVELGIIVAGVAIFVAAKLRRKSYRKKRKENA